MTASTRLNLPSLSRTRYATESTNACRILVHRRVSGRIERIFSTNLVNRGCSVTTIKCLTSTEGVNRSLLVISLRVLTESGGRIVSAWLYTYAALEPTGNKSATFLSFLGQLVL